MKSKLVKSVVFILSIVLYFFCFPITPAYAQSQGTDGNEIQVLEAEKLEIQLGSEWSGVEFKLKTDAGLYPGTITVGDDGVLRTEIGGSKSYILTCMNSSVSVPKLVQAPATTELQTDDDSGNIVLDVNNNQKNMIAGIPVWHIVLFCGGMVIAVGILIVMHVKKNQRESDYDDEDD
ncbi:MAG: hypothetical protein NC124_18050 [Clostridium sp.]|nr:hypothetical protein [Clostridium sp.]